MDKKEVVYNIVKEIPEGKVLTYGRLAKMAGINSPRQVGHILHINPYSDVPCYRVVNFQGKVAEKYAFGGESAQRAKLKKEGVALENGRINLDKYLWGPE